MAVTRAQLIAIAIAGSVALHVGIAASVASIRKAPVRRGPTSIRVQEAKKKKVEPKKEKPPEPVVAKNEPTVAKRTTPPKQAPKAAEPKAAPVAAAAAAPVAEFNLTLGNGVGGGPGGIAVPTYAAHAPTASATTAPQPKVLVAKAASVDECSDPPTKPKPIKVVQPTYTEKAREAQIEGRVRVEIVVDESGNVSGAKVIAGLGHGLDEAALAAAKSSTFAAATRCGKPVSATFVIGMRFNL